MLRKSTCWGVIVLILALACQAPSRAGLIANKTTQNLFGTLNGISTSSISSKISSEYSKYKSQRVGYTNSTAYIKGDNSDVLTEGMGYGMMIAVQMNDHTLFDQLYGFVQRYMLFTDTSGSYAYAKGYHRWKVNTDGSSRSDGNSVAPDGEEWIAAALVIAGKRWTSGSYSYTSEGLSLWHKLMYPEINYGGYCIDPNSGNAGYHIVRFGPYNAITDPSYIVPGFYAQVADAGGSDSSAYSDCYTKGHNFLQNTPSSSSGTNWGLHPDYADWNGNPVQGYSGDTYGPAFSYDAFRTTMNMAIEIGWTNANNGYYWQVAARRQDQFYYYSNTVGAKVGLGAGGYYYGQLLDSGKPVSLIGPNACASALYNWSNSERASFTNSLWNSYHPSDYYSDCLYMICLMVCGGQFYNSF